MHGFPFFCLLVLEEIFGALQEFRDISLLTLRSNQIQK